MALRIELLGGHAGRDRFDCGVAALNDFLSRRAGQQQRKGFGKTLSNDRQKVTAADLAPVIDQLTRDALQFQTAKAAP